MGWETETFAYDRPHPRMKACVRYLDDPAVAKVLELGCGIGVLRAQLSGVEHWGCDVSTAAVAKIDDPHVVVSDLNVDGVPFAGERFDAVVASGVLEYVADLPACLREVHERLRPGGLLVVSFTNFARLRDRVLATRGKARALRTDHLTRWPLPQLRVELRAAGFVIEREVGVGLRPWRRTFASAWVPPAPLRDLVADQVVVRAIRG